MTAKHLPIPTGGAGRSAGPQRPARRRPRVRRLAFIRTDDSGFRLRTARDLASGFR